MIILYIIIAICAIIICAVIGYYLSFYIRRRNNNKIFLKRKATADLFYQSKNLQYMAKIFKKKNSDAYILKIQIVHLEINSAEAKENPDAFYIGGMSLTVRDKDGNVYGKYYYDNTIKYGENEVREGTLDIKDVKKNKIIDFDIDLAPGAVKPDGSFDLLVDSQGLVMKYYTLCDETVTGIPCKKEANAQ